MNLVFDNPHQAESVWIDDAGNILYRFGDSETNHGALAAKQDRHGKPGCCLGSGSPGRYAWRTSTFDEFRAFVCEARLGEQKWPDYAVWACVAADRTVCGVAHSQADDTNRMTPCLFVHRVLLFESGWSRQRVVLALDPAQRLRHDR